MTQEEPEIKKITLKIHFEKGESIGVLGKLVADGWKIQERSFYDAEFGKMGKQLEWAYLEYFHKY